MERRPSLDSRVYAEVHATMVLGLFLIGAASVICQVRIMPLGDSITRGVHGSSDSTGYRRALYQLLTGAGYSIDFVGTQRDGIPKDFDRDHEGHSGWRADQIRDNISGWLTTNPADIILLHIGTNDISQHQTVSSTISEVNQILDRIDAKSTATVVFLARIINRNDTLSDTTTQFNRRLQSLADTRIANGDLIFVVNQEAALNYPADLFDAVHPNDAGYAKMAQCWFPALSTYLSTLPVQLSSFTGRIINQSVVRLEWTTVTETNNFGFEVQRSTNGRMEYQTLSNSFVPGHGTSLIPHSYWYADTSAVPGTSYYRLKQIDLDGAVEYSDDIGLNIVAGAKDSLPWASVLLQGYPNPFNSSATIKYELPKPSMVNLAVYDILGREVSVLVNEKKNAGEYEVRFDASGLSSGVYLYRLQARPLGNGQAGEVVQAKRLVLLK